MDSPELIEHYNRMRELADHLPEWEDASETIKSLHRKTFGNLIKPTIEKIKSSLPKQEKYPNNSYSL